MEIEKVLNLINSKIKELDERAFKHCFKRGKMCDECWERKVPLIELKDKFVLLGQGEVKE